MIKDGRIKAYKVGREWKFLRADIMAYLESASSDRLLSMAAKGGGTDKDDMETPARLIQKKKIPTKLAMFDLNQKNNYII